MSFEAQVDEHETDVFLGPISMFQNLEKVLVNPGWSALRQVSSKVSLHVVARRCPIEIDGNLPSSHGVHREKEVICLRRKDRFE